MRVAYLYLMRDRPDQVNPAAPARATYCRELAPPGYLGGPFADRSGGLITVDVDSWKTAEQLVGNDSLHHTDLLDGRWLKECTVAP
jgi:hypothetical protein